MTCTDGPVWYIISLLLKTIFLICLYTVGQIINLAAGGEFSYRNQHRLISTSNRIISIDFFDSTKANKSNIQIILYKKILQHGM